jgi:hypothetical protein
MPQPLSQISTRIPVPCGPSSSIASMLMVGFSTPSVACAALLIRLENT